MAQSYTRQSSFADGDTITAALFNDEYNQLINTFAYSSSDASNTGHRHDGTSGQGGNIFKIGDIDFLNKIEVDGTNNRIGFYVEVSSSAVEQIRVQDGAVVPVTDNDIDLGTSSLEFKDAFFDGTVTADALVADTADINGGTVDGAIIGGSSAAAITGTTITGTTITGTSFVIGSADINEAELETIDGVTAGTVAASKAVVVDSNKDIASFRNVTLTGELDAGSLDISGDADIDGTLEADAITVNGATLNEVITDAVGSMVSSNTETGISVTFDDSDNTLDFVIGTLNQDTTGNAATATALETARTIHGVSFDGTANIDLSEVIQDTVGAMVSSNTESGITVAYQDGDGTLDFTIGTLNQDTTGTAALATAVTISANNSTDETIFPVFVDGATGTQGLETDTGFTYNPSTGLLTATGFSGNLTGTLQTAAQTNVTSVGTLSALTVTGDATFDTSTLKVDSSNNRVGIGTSSPSKLLHMTGSAAQIRIEDSDGTNQIADIASDSGDMLITSRNNTSNGQIRFRRYNGTTVSESARFDTSGNLGIGTSSPSEKLHVVGDVLIGTGISYNASADDILTIGATNRTAVNNGTYFNYQYKVSGAATGQDLTLQAARNIDGSSEDVESIFQYDASSDAQIFFTNATERVRIDSSGNLLVGKTSSGTTTAGFEARANGQTVATFDGGTALIANRESSHGDAFKIMKDGATQHVFGTQNVGIGTSSPDDLLTISKNASSDSPSLIVRRSTDTSSSGDFVQGIKFANGTLSQRAEIQAVQGSQYADNIALNFVTMAGLGNRGTRMHIGGTGDVGIGTDSPVSLGGHDGVLTLFGSNATALVLKNSTSTSRLAQLGSDLGFFVATHENERMRLTSAGLGIGISSVQTQGALTGNLLEIHQPSFGSGVGGTLVLSSDNTANGRHGGRIIGRARSYVHSSIDFQADSGMANGGLLKFSTLASGSATSDNPTERMRIDSSGRLSVGISSSAGGVATFFGTGTGAEAKVQIEGEGGADPFINFLVNNTTHWAVGARDSDSDKFMIANNSDLSSGVALTIDSSENVGIGVTSPSQRLEVAGNIKANASNGSGFLLNSSSTTGIFRQNSNDLGFTVGGSERMRILSGGAVMVGTTSLASGTGIQLKNEEFHVNIANGSSLFRNVRSDTAGNALTLDRNTGDGDLLDLKKADSSQGAIGVIGNDIFINSTDEGRLHVGGTGRYSWSDTSFAPQNDNARDLGSSSVRWQDVYATNGTIQTSDRNEKQDIAELSEAEARVAVAVKGLLRKFKWKDAVAEKGDEARIHFGIIAQDLQDAFTAEGLDAGDYGMFISSTWTDDDGVEQTRLGVRYSELIAFIIAGI